MEEEGGNSGGGEDERGGGSVTLRLHVGQGALGRQQVLECRQIVRLYQGFLGLEITKPCIQLYTVKIDAVKKKY